MGLLKTAEVRWGLLKTASGVWYYCKLLQVGGDIEHCYRWVGVLKTVTVGWDLKTAEVRWGQMKSLTGGLRLLKTAT
ncbi:hypothetical protein DPMN_042607 [Dreissena polymorpha]|uniref:Uncharacterized protein n=1 Tax=Dreissena polymorpha TaxID=45954 RepID=A0A9D4D0T5_DREPO|nr:hypothetical protein DPMN_042607 [Dreissena polymorpha]